MKKRNNRKNKRCKNKKTGPGEGPDWVIS